MQPAPQTILLLNSDTGNHSFAPRCHVVYNSDGLPEAVAAACHEFIYGALADNPHRVGKQLEAPLWPKYSARRGEYRVIYEILEQQIVVHVVTIQHRRDAYRFFTPQKSESLWSVTP